jgi:16S rRNA (cytosine1402-N4)-methyltransferase
MISQILARTAERPDGFSQIRRAMGEDDSAVAGGMVPHIPVLGREVVDFLNPAPNKRYIDATFGAGGYTKLLLAANSRVLGLDRDRTAITLGAGLVEQSGGRLELIEANFSELAELAGEPVDGVVFDLGVSSMQLDTAERGFSFRLDGPLDMRMGHDGPSAAELVAKASERDLANIIFQLGEERQSRAVARAIVKARGEAPITTTKRLADLVASVVRHKPTEIHPATRTFQAMRMFVNDELGELVSGLAAAEQVLKPGARLAVVSFHSLEDRIVKLFINDRSATSAGSRHRPEVQKIEPTFNALTRRVVTPGEDEIAQNPRARSAKLRAAERTATAPRDAMPDLLPNLPSVTDAMRGG